MPKVTGDAALHSMPLLLLSAAHLWLFQACVSGLTSARPPSVCSSPPLSTIGLLVLAFVELTHGSRTRGALALVAVAIPMVLNVVYPDAVVALEFNSMPAPTEVIN